MTADVRWVATFSPDAGAARRARLAVHEALAHAAIDPLVLGDVLLVLGELVANALWHARTDFTVCADARGGVLRIEVFDHDTRPPTLLGLDRESTSGRGLHLVASTATNWGWNSVQEDNGLSGKVVWAELAIDGGAPIREM